MEPEVADTLRERLHARLAGAAGVDLAATYLVRRANHQPDDLPQALTNLLAVVQEHSLPEPHRFLFALARVVFQGTEAARQSAQSLLETMAQEEPWAGDPDLTALWELSHT